MIEFFRIHASHYIVQVAVIHKPLRKSEVLMGVMDDFGFLIEGPSPAYCLMYREDPTP